jgi:hypothetical protein
MSDEESAPTAEGVAAEAPAAEAEVEAEPEAEPTPPIELNLPPEVAEGLTNVMKALEEFGKTVKPFLDESHAGAAEAAGKADPLIMPEGVAKIEATITEWSTKVNGQIEPLKAYIARIEKERVPIDEYIAALKEVFKEAQPAPEPEAAESVS